MTTHDPPARPWYDAVIEELALKGWTKAELTERSGVAKSTIDNWAKNPRKPQSAKVNAVADELGIPRKRALRLAGIIASAPDVPKEVQDAVRKAWPDPADQQRVIESIAESMNGAGAPVTPGAKRPDETE